MVRNHLSRVVQVVPIRPAYAASLRAAVATVLPIVAGTALGWHEALWMGLAGFNVSLGDKGGPWRVRFRAMSASLISGALAAGVGAVAGRHPWSAVLMMAVVALHAGLARSWGTTATGAGIVSMATYIVSIGYPAADVREAFLRTGAVIAGGLFAMALTLLSSPNRPYRPARAAVARAFRAIAAGDHEAARQAVIDARMILAALRRGQTGESVRGERLLMLVERADRMRTAGPPRDDLEAIAAAIVKEHSNELPEKGDEVITAVRELNEGREPAPPLNFHDLTHDLTWSSAVLRHALRVAAASAAAVAITSGLHVERGYWLTLSVIVILQPYTSSTFQKGLQRVGGTIAGGLLAAALLALVHSKVEMIALIFVGAALTIALLPINYALYSLFLTPTFILLAEVNATDWHLVWLRVGNTAAGAGLAYAAAWLLWPASERGLVRDELAAALRGLADYSRCVGECDDLVVAASRRAAHVALENAEASLQRLIGDVPGEEAEALMSLTTYSRRYARALSALAAATPDRYELLPVTRYAAAALESVATGARPPQPPQAPESAERLLYALKAIERAAERLRLLEDERALA